MFVDFAWNYLVQNEKYVLYDLIKDPNTDVYYTSSLNNYDMKIMTTFGLRF
jgi:hypothetical protein